MSIALLSNLFSLVSTNSSTVRNVAMGQDLIGGVLETLKVGLYPSDAMSFVRAAVTGYSTDDAGGNAGEIVHKSLEGLAKRTILSKIPGINFIFGIKDIALGCSDLVQGMAKRDAGNFLEAFLNFASGFACLVPGGVVAVSALSKLRTKSISREASTNAHLVNAFKAARDKGDDATEAFATRISNEIGDKRADFLKAYRVELKTMKKMEHPKYNALLKTACEHPDPREIVAQAGTNAAHGLKSMYGAMKTYFNRCLEGSPTFSLTTA